MYQPPEVYHLQRAVEAVRKNLLPQKQKEPEPISDEESHDETQEETETTK